MTHSKVFTDGEYCVVLVAHVEGVNEVMDGDGHISGLLEYSVDLESGDLFVYDGDDEVIYSARDDLDSDTLDTDAIRSLVTAIDEDNAVYIAGSEYWNIIKRYQQNTDDPEGALSGVHPVGTIIRLGYGGAIDEADAFVKRDVDFWEVTGGFTTYTDEEIESEDYEVIYHA